VDVRDLDRAVSRTELSPLVKLFLRRVRRAIDRGDVEGFTITKSAWSVSVMDTTGFCCTYVFALRKENGNDKN